MRELELCTEKVKSLIFFARYDACQHGSRSVKPEHLLLGLLRVDPELFQLFSAGQRDEAADIRAAVEQMLALHGPIELSGITPLSRSAKFVIKLAAEEGTRLGHSYIGTEHILLSLLQAKRFRALGLIRKGPSWVSDILRERGFSVQRIASQVRAGSVTTQDSDKSNSVALGRSPI